MHKDIHDLSEQVRVLNSNLKRESEIAHSKSTENKTLYDENKMLKNMLEELKQSSKSNKTDQHQLIENLRLQLDETRDMIVRIKESKEKEFRKLRERYDDERRREAEKY